MSINNNLKYRKDIDALRGIAVILVVIYHAFPNILPGGFIGVDIFFVISGYLITTIIYNQIKNDNFSFMSFYIRRIRRIFPALFTVLITTYLIGWLILFTDEFQQLGSHIWRSTLFIQNFKLIKELGYFDVSSHYKPLLHLWTLSIEEQYYLLWPAILVLITKFIKNPKYIVYILVLSSFLANIYFVGDYKDKVFFHSLTRFWELGVGSLLAIHLYENPKFTDWKNTGTSFLLFSIGIGCIIYSCFWITSDSLFPSWIGVIPVIGGALIIISNLKLKNWGGLVAIGLISYPLYLWHWVVFSFIYIYIGMKPSANYLFAAIFIALFLSFLTTRYIEKIRHTKSNVFVTGLIIFSVFVGASGKITELESGFPQRSHISYVNKFNIEFARTAATDSSCDSHAKKFNDNERLFDYCRAAFHDKNKKTIAIIGDSHAHTLFPGIAEIAEKHSFNTILLANSSCPPLIDFMWGRSSKEIKKCQQKIKQILSILRNDQNIEKVVMATRGPVYIHGEVTGQFTKESVLESLGKAKAPNRQTYELYSSGFNKSLSQLQLAPHIKNIFYFLENPELDFTPKEVIPRPFDYWGISKHAHSIDKYLYQKRMKTYRESILEVCTNYSKVKAIDVEPYLCGTTKCHAYLNDNFLYADNDHFSVFGSKYIAQKSENLIFPK